MFSLFGLKGLGKRFSKNFRDKTINFFNHTMKRFFTLSFLLASFALFGQNLIPDGSAEDFVKCPTGLGILETWNPNWQSFRGTPDYFNNCSEGLGSENPLGYQEPRTGEGYLGAILHHTSLPNAREYFGVQLSEVLIEGQQYYLSFFTTMAYRVSGGSRTACNNLGVLLMDENFLDSNEQGEIPNFASFSLDTILKDTTAWVHIEYAFIAEDAYSFIAFGNFFDDSMTEFEFPFEPDNAGIAYYYFDDFCLSNNQMDCDPFLNVTTDRKEERIKIWPNPSYTSSFYYRIDFVPQGYKIFALDGKQVAHKPSHQISEGIVEHKLNSGVYLIELYSNKQSVKRRFVVQ